MWICGYALGTTSKLVNQSSKKNPQTTLEKLGNISPSIVNTPRKKEKEKEKKAESTCNTSLY
jgi:hypothetical protein